MEPDPFALAILIRSTGKSAAEIARLLRQAGRHVTSPTVESWMKLPGASKEPTRPRWHLLADLAVALHIPLGHLLVAYAGVPRA